MSIFRLPSWVIKAIDRIRRDFLWSGAEIDKPKMRLVSWNRICRPREHGGWGILNLDDFNLALLGKWWWKFTTGVPWCGREIILYNYFQNSPLWNLHNRPPQRRSFIWNGLLQCLPAFRNCISSIVHNGDSTLFWLDKWVENRAPMLLWPEQFILSNRPFDTVQNLAHLLQSPWFVDGTHSTIGLLSSSVPNTHGLRDSKKWSLTANGRYTVKSFYGFLRHGGGGSCVRPPI